MSIIQDFVFFPEADMTTVLGEREKRQPMADDNIMDNAIKDVIRQLMVFQPAQRENVFALAEAIGGLTFEDRATLKNTVDLIAEFTNGTMRQKSGRPRGSRNKQKEQA